MSTRPTSNLASTTTPTTAAEIISLLNLEPYSEKGYLHETFRDPVVATSNSPGYSNRSASTAIYYLLEGREGYSLWHRVDAAEVWHYYAGAPLTLELVYEGEEGGGSGGGGGKVEEEGEEVEIRLGVDLRAGERPQGVVPRGVWQRARCLGEWTLLGTTGEFLSFLFCFFIFIVVVFCSSSLVGSFADRVPVAPGFEPSGFIIMPEGWQPGDPEPAKSE